MRILGGIQEIVFIAVLIYETDGHNFLEARSKNGYGFKEAFFSKVPKMDQFIDNRQCYTNYFAWKDLGKKRNLEFLIVAVF